MHVLLQFRQQVQGLDGGEDVHVGHPQLFQHGLGPQVHEGDLVIGGGGGIPRGRALAGLQLLQDLPGPAYDPVGDPGQLGHLHAVTLVRAAPDDLPLGPTLDAAAPGALVCGGLLNAAVPALQAHSLRWFDYARDETLALENAELTAEAALPPLLARLPCPLRGSRILILGFGRIGKRLAWKLHTLGAAVTVAARRPEALALARILGLQAEPLGPQLRGLAVYDAVVNTVPAPVICDVQLSAIRPDTALLELASLPGGFCPAAADRAGYLAARGLPGVYAPEAAAAVIRRAIFRELDLEECP